MSQSQLQANPKFNTNNNKHLHLMQKVKDPLYRPGQALRFQVVRGSQISKQSLHEGDKVVSLMHRPSLHPENIPGTHFC